MAICFDETANLLSLHTRNSTYQMKIDPYGVLLHLYYGSRTEGNMDYLLAYLDRGFSGNPADAGEDRTYSLDVLPQEYPAFGTGDYRSPALIVRNADGSFACDLRYVCHSIQKGKYGLPGLPAVYAGEEEAETLAVTLADNVSRVEVQLLYGVLPEHDVITRSVILRNRGAGEIRIEKITSASLDMLGGDFDLITFGGRYAMERSPHRAPLVQGARSVGSLRGQSSHQANPMLILAGRDATEDGGRCYAMSFVFSGGFLGKAELDQLGLTRMQLGLQEEMFSYPLAPGQAFTAPEVVMSFSGGGLNRLSQNLHGCFRDHLCRGPFKASPRPVLINSWESCYYFYDGDAICELAEQAAGLGMDMVVLDDGWFGRRENDRGGLGDWVVNEKKLGQPLGRLIERINGLGVKFGIWIEPECVSEDSDLYRAHPDWAFVIPGRAPERSRSQLVLDFSRREVVDAVLAQVFAVLDQGNVEYIKWDCNRSVGNLYSHAARDQGRVLYDHMLGVYDFLDRLGKRYPHMLIETCSGGGGRFDAGMLYYSPQIWCSDNTDALDRLCIQYGTSFGYPMSSVGAHVSACPNHQTGRSVPLRTRGVVAMAGAFGYELNPGTLTEAEREEIRRQIATYKRHENLIRYGLYYRLTDPFTDPVAAWAFVGGDGKELLFNAVARETHGNMTVSYVRLRGLRRDGLYRERETGRLYPAGALMDTGLPILPAWEEYAATQMYFELV